MARSAGLYEPSFEHDACGVNFVADLKGRKSHSIVQMGLGALCNLEHRGATGADVNSGDGAGILMQVPDRFLRDVVPFRLPREGGYATGIAFLPQDEEQAAAGVSQIESIVEDEGLEVLGWRDVPTDPSMLGRAAAQTMPRFRQVFIAGRGLSSLALDRYVYMVRKRIEHEIHLMEGRTR